MTAHLDSFADVGLLGGRAQRFPACGLGHPEDVGLAEVVAVLQLRFDNRGDNIGQQLGRAARHKVVVGRVGKAARQLNALGTEGVGDLLDEDQAEHQVLVLGGVHVGAQLVGGGPQCLLDVF